MADKNKNSSKQSEFFPPIVAVVGHVDHGKTTLLDAIRKSNVASFEAGGITQKIGASTVEIMHEKVARRITFIDTPGHAAFFAMRSRGAKAADIGLLIVSAADGVMPQTKESIQVLKDANIPFIVVLTKTDLPEKNIEKTKQQLLKEEVMLEGLGGEVPVIEVSAKTNKNIKELLGLILLVFDMRQDIFKDRSKDKALMGIVIESKLDQRAGPKTTVVVKNGTLRVRDEIHAGHVKGKVRGLLTSQNKQVKEAGIGEAVEILGFEGLPPVGSIVSEYSENSARQKIRSSNTQIIGSAGLPSSSEFSGNSPTIGASSQFLHHDENALSIILVTDTIGSLEAITASLPKEIIIAAKKTGDINAADIFHAKSTKSIVVGFNTPVKSDIMQLARTEKVLTKNYTLIYELLEELQDVMEGKALALIEEIFGKAKILASFPYEKTKVLGIVVLEGRVAKGDKVRLIRNDEVIGESTISSVRQGKNQISKIEDKAEGGIILSPFLDFTIGDVLLCHR